MSDNIKIVAAAVTDGNIVVAGVRHFDPIMGRVLKQVNIWDNTSVTQGFVDNKGNFHNRKESLKIAIEANQVDMSKKFPPQDELFSEDLY